MVVWGKCECGKWFDSENYNECFECSQLSKGFKRCPKCNNHFYDPKKYSYCYKCHQQAKNSDLLPELENQLNSTILRSDS
jgi:hypothetical protein